MPDLFRLGGENPHTTPRRLFFFDQRTVAALRPVYSDTTQLNSTGRRVELSCVGEVSIATQLNST